MNSYEQLLVVSQILIFANKIYYEKNFNFPSEIRTLIGMVFQYNQ